MKIIILALLIAGSAFSDPVYSQEQKKNHVFGEIGGQGILFSLNYERILIGQTSARIGVSYFMLKLGDDPADRYFFLPVLINQAFGSGRHKLETGLGSVIQIVKVGEHKKGISPTANLGYRYVSETGLVFRIVFTPVYLSWEKRFMPMGGLSVGGLF
jgi:hypothetical protein